MARRKRHNPERRAWKGRSYKASGRRIQTLKESTISPGALDAMDTAEDAAEERLAAAYEATATDWEFSE